MRSECIDIDVKKYSPGRALFFETAAPAARLFTRDELSLVSCPILQRLASHRLAERRLAASADRSASMSTPARADSGPGWTYASASAIRSYSDDGL